MDYEWKIEQLRLMLKAEANEEHGGYGAHLNHWAGTAKPINLDADAIQTLIDHYTRLSRQDVNSVESH